jgi:[CysO sulfur-carrier protein]-S-L-cysteine hydrolase
VRIPAALLEELLEHARRESPNECCGFVALDDGGAVDVLPAENIAASPMRFEVGPSDLLRITEIEDAGRDVAIYHSHTRSAPYPSQTDVNFAANWPGVQWLIIGLAGDEPEVRNYRIDGGVVTEVEVALDGR